MPILVHILKVIAIATVTLVIVAAFVIAAGINAAARKQSKTSCNYYYYYYYYYDYHSMPTRQRRGPQRDPPFPPVPRRSAYY